MREIRLAVPAVTDSEWRYSVPNIPRGQGIFIVFKTEEILLRTGQFSSNRILHNDDKSKFISASFKDFRMPDYTTVDYMKKFFKAGLFLNGRQYRFYHHSNSQLRERSCYLREAENDEELDARIYRYGDFLRITNTAKRAKRIGLLFSGASIDYQLKPEFTEDIDDLMVGDENFSDGCGLISHRLAVALCRSKKIIFRGARYTPSVYQIRYRGYKGVLMLHPDLDKARGKLAQFRKSMRKFNATLDNTFSVVDYSTPYSFGRLNNDVIVLISSLGITNETLLAKQAEYFQWLTSASTDVSAAVDLLCSLGDYNMAERVLLDGLDADAVRSAVNSIVTREVKSFRKDTGKARSRMIVRKSRLLFGVCDPFGVLREGEVHVRISAGRQPATTLTHCDVLVVRNPCLHPGDVLKLRTVDNPKLQHLTDCVVFASVGRRAAASMTSGGDLDGDKFFVCWDEDIVPKQITDSYAYPPGKERINRSITRQDLAAHFASYSGASVAKVARLHDKWARYSPAGAMCPECLELNALHSLAVDGGRIKVPPRLSDPPEGDTPYIIDVLAKAAEDFAENYLHAAPVESLVTEDQDDTVQLIRDLLGSEQHALPEWGLVQRCMALARKRRIDFTTFLPQIDFSSLSSQERYALAGALPPLSPEDYARIWNSLFQSDVLGQSDLHDRNLDRPLRFQRFYTSRVQGRAAFFEYLYKATRDYTRKLLVLKVNDHLAVGIFIRGNIVWEDLPEDDDVASDPLVDRDGRLQITVCSFEFRSSRVMSTYKVCPPGFRLHCRGGRLQLYEKNIANTFVYVGRPPINSPHDVIASVALQKFSRSVQQQLGRVNKDPLVDLEIHVISNRDRVAHQAFDLRFEHVQTEEVLRESRQPRRYALNTLSDIDWSTHPNFQVVFEATKENIETHLSNRTTEDVSELMSFAVQYRAENHVFWIFEALLGRAPLPLELVEQWIDRRPDLAYVVLKAYQPDTEEPSVIWQELAIPVLRGVIRSGNTFGIASLVALEKLHAQISRLDLDAYSDLVHLGAHCIRITDLMREMLLVLHEQRSSNMMYFEKQILAVCCDRAEEAFDECPMNDKGNVRRGAKGIRTPLSVPAESTSTRTVKAIARVDKSNPIRLHSHVRIQAASAADGPHVDRHIVSGIVVEAPRGDLKIRVLDPLPPEFTEMDWDIYDASSVATTNAMLDAVKRLASEGEACCGLVDIISRSDAITPAESEPLSHPWNDAALNESQNAAVNSIDSPLSLIWGPPGTGKTTVVLAILERFIRARPESKILMAASTHNAVDNVLKRFASIATAKSLLEVDSMIRVSTDVSKVDKDLQRFTIDAMLGGSPTDDPKLVKRAQARVDNARIVFTTCAGAGLGLLRNAENFEIVVIDEASQVTEPASLIPMVKGCKRAVLVGDHVQLRPMARKMSTALEYDVSLMERLYRASDRPGIRKTMLDVQYRFPPELARFPSEEFYEGRLRSGPQQAPALPGAFPWPRSSGSNAQVGTVFVQCGGEEDYGKSSKSNADQAALAQHVVKLILQDAPPETTVAVLTPYRAQQALLRAALPAGVACSSIDGFQGREADVVVFCTVRCNAARDLGFLIDRRRLNVVWTRARHALVVIGDQDTLRGINAAEVDDETGRLAAQQAAHAMWTRALSSCAKVSISLPDAPVQSARK